jgi:cytochrome c oxidase accessory protein FixG
MSQELPKNRLATTDQRGNRVYLYPADVRGFLRNRKTLFHAALTILFLGLPWITVSGRQLLLLDVVHREFYFFGLHFRSHDAPLVLFLFLAFVFLIGFVTTVWGRVWCGWACPQTVFTEFLFRRLERLVEGAPRARRELDESPWTLRKLAIKSTKYGLFAIISLAITHSFLAYFVGSHELFRMISGPPAENWGSFLVILVTTAVILFDFGWFREQFCVIACPYGRFQSVILDDHSLVVGYDPRRGEPRRGEVPKGAIQGDCVNCYRCVQVCPTGIDIRRGLQMECVGCTACIDACDAVMAKTARPAGLISYTTLARLAGEKARVVRPQAIAFLSLFLLVAGGLVTVLLRTNFLEATVLRAPESPYQINSSPAQAERVINHFRVELSNQTSLPAKLNFRIAETAGLEQAELIMPQNPVSLAEGASARAEFFVQFSPALLVHGARKIILKMNDSVSDRDLEVTLVGPGL